MGETITFDIRYEGSRIKTLGLDQESKDKLNERDQNRSLNLEECLKIFRKLTCLN